MFNDNFSGNGCIINLKFISLHFSRLAEKKIKLNYDNKRKDNFRIFV